MIPDTETLQYVGDRWGFAALIVIVLLVAIIWAIREEFRRRDAQIAYYQQRDAEETQYQRQKDSDESQYRRERDDKTLALLEKLATTQEDLVTHVNRLADERLWSVVQARQPNAGD